MFSVSKFRSEYCPILHRESVHDHGYHLLFRVIVDAIPVGEVGNLGEQDGWLFTRFQLGFRWTRKRNCPRPLQYISISRYGKAGLVSTDKLVVLPSTGVPHHCCELQEGIATQFVNSQLNVIEPGLDLSLRFLRIEDYTSVIPIHRKEAGIGELLVYLLKNVRGH
jgi:hypothetical protein